MNSREADLTARSEADMGDLGALAGLDADASLALVQRTRRAVREAAISMQEQRLRKRRNGGMAILVWLSLAVLLAPALWTCIEDLLGGEHVADLPAQVAFLLLMLFPAMLAALLAAWKGRREVRHDRGGL